VLGQAGKAIKNMTPEKRARYIKYMISKGFIRGIMSSARQGMSPKQVAKLLKGFNGQRIPPFALLAIIGYLEEELANDRLFTEVAQGTTYEQNVARLQTKILNASFNFISGNGNGNVARLANGSAFQIMHLALLHALASETGDVVIGIEVPRDVIAFSNLKALEGKNPRKGALTFGRDVDIMLKNSQGEIWVETKSWQSRKDSADKPTGKPYSFKPWTWATGNRVDKKMRRRSNWKGLCLINSLLWIVLPPGWGLWNEVIVSLEH
jgi:hypothetical protein